MTDIRQYVYLNGRLHCTRHWPAVPAKGDLLLVREVENRDAWCAVEEVRWIDRNGELDRVDIFVTVNQRA